MTAGRPFGAHLELILEPDGSYPCKPGNSDGAQIVPKRLGMEMERFISQSRCHEISEQDFGSRLERDTQLK